MADHLTPRMRAAVDGEPGDRQRAEGQIGGDDAGQPSGRELTASGALGPGAEPGLPASPSARAVDGGPATEPTALPGNHRQWEITDKGRELLQHPEVRHAG